NAIRVSRAEAGDATGQTSRGWTRAGERASGASRVVLGAARVPLVELGAAPVGTEAEHPDVVELRLALARDRVEEQRPAVRHDETAVDRDRLVGGVVAGAGEQVSLRQPLGDDRVPASSADAERVDPARVLGPQVGDGGRVV